MEQALSPLLILIWSFGGLIQQPGNLRETGQRGSEETSQLAGQNPEVEAGECRLGSQHQDFL